MCREKGMNITINNTIHSHNGSKKTRFSPQSYMKSLYKSFTIGKSKKKSKVSDDMFVMINKDNYHLLLENNYRVKQLRSIARYHKQKISGNKEEILKRLYHYFKFSTYAEKIQTLYRGHLIRRFFKLSKSMEYNRKKCVNDTDFFLMEPISNIPFHELILYKSEDFIYSFSICSLYNLYKQHNNWKKVKNPYNRNIFRRSLYKRMINMITLGKKLKLNINIDIPVDEVTYENSTGTTHQLQQHVQTTALNSYNVDGEHYNNHIVSLCQKIDLLGNYTNVDWFLSLTRNHTISYIRELYDIWNYRAQLTMEMKRNICPPNGNPFYRINISTLRDLDITQLKQYFLHINYKLIETATNEQYQQLGALYILSALTLVNTDCASALPWLYESVVY